MIFGKGECRRTRRTSNENLTKSAKIATFWQGSFYSCLACRFGVSLHFENEFAHVGNVHDEIIGVTFIKRQATGRKPVAFT